MPGSPMQNNMFTASSGYKQKGNPFPVTSCGRRRNTGSPLFKADPLAAAAFFDLLCITMDLVSFYLAFE